MNKYKKSHRLIATFFMLIFFPSLIPANLFASNNGPKSPEATSFEPVDATDMVNLITGQGSYVLPLLNVPSPEGGYPLALGYHSGIALDQEASWTGLGWNVNPGAIDRGINGYADDYNASHLNEYFYDSGGQEYASFVSVGYSCGVASVGLGFNWGSNQSLGGSVSVGIGFDVGTAGVGINATAGSSGSSIGVGAQFAGGLSVGINANSNGDVGVSAGFNSNGAGFSLGYNTSGSYAFNTRANETTGFSLSTSKAGTHSSLSVGGIGSSTSFNNTAKMGDYSTNQSSWMVPIVVPTPIGVFSLSFGRQDFKYWLAKNENNYVTGPIYFEQGIKHITKQVWVQRWARPGQWETVIVGKAFMDINEVPIGLTGFLGTSTDVSDNNITFPSYDNYNVQAQGLSGSMSATLLENGVLSGLSEKENSDNYKIDYSINGGTAILPDYAKFNAKPNFYFDNEISSNLETNVPVALFNLNAANTEILNHYAGGVELNAKPRRKTSTFIEYYTNNEISTNYAALKQNGYLEGNASGFDRSIMPKDGIGAFKITTVDGKTYHYSLPVYNHEIITRTFGTIEDRPDESQSYFEKRQLEPYATHWLLTAVTGSDYVDNGDGVASAGDLGYWTSFEYGKWTDAFIWKAPYKKDYLTDDKNPKVKTWIRGRKQLYYLDKVRTRTHTALFIKSERLDAKSENWEYKSVIHKDNDWGSYLSRFTIPSQSQLRLDKIILLKNTDDTVNKTAGADLNQSATVTYNESDKIEETAKFNIKDNVLDVGDNWSGNIAKALKVIDFTYDYSLVPGDNRLTLKTVNFKGKGGSSVLPPYKFDYINNNSTFNVEKNDGWGYLADAPDAFSLRKITTPQGGTIEMNYESNKFKSITPVTLEFLNSNLNKFTSTMPTYSSPSDLANKTVEIDIGSSNSYPNLINQTVSITLVRDYVCFNDLFYYFKYDSTGHITSDLGGGKYRVSFNQNVYLGNHHNGFSSGVQGCNMGLINTQIANDSTRIYDFEQIRVKLDLPPNTIYSSGGIRVANIKASDGVNNYITDYKFGDNEDGIGYVNYIPYVQNSTKEVPFSAELPAPRVMYEYVTMASHKEGVLPEAKTRYKFNIVKQKTAGIVEYGDFYKISKTQNRFINSLDVLVDASSYTVKDNWASVGQLLEVSTLTSQGHQLSKISNNYYKTTDVIPNNVGITQESYQSYKTVDYITNGANVKDKWNITSSTRIKYPNLLKSSTEQRNGYTYTTEFKDFDLISGVAKEQRSVSSDGQSLKTRMIPAYLKYPEMGSKVDYIDNRNMLSQTAVNYSYIQVDKANDIWKETGVGITTWSNMWNYKDIGGDTTTPTNSKEKIWRKHKSYIWNGVVDNDGIFMNYNNNAGSDDGFDWTVGVGSQPAKWKQTSEMTLYNHYSAPLEIKDINNNFATTKMGDNDTKVIATGNAGYNELFYAGAENIMYDYYLEPEVRIQSAARSINFAHTGKYSVETTPNSQFGVYMRGGQHRAGRYKLSVWVHKNNAQNARIRAVGVNPVDFNGESYKAGDWILKTHYFDCTTLDTFPYVTSASGSVYYDDFMLRPVVSSITGYVYNEYDELVSIIGSNGLATKFEYDAAGRVIKTYIEVVEDENVTTSGFKLKTTNKINYKNL